MFRKSRKMHFIGIGGIGMSGIAEILINLGYEVSGSDLHESEQTRRLAALGARISIGHHAENIGEECHVVVTSSAIAPTNPELIEARRRRIPVIHRSEMLAELVRMKHGIGVAGTHGKTTITSMLSYVLFHGGLNPTAVVGGKVLNFNTNARVGEGDYIVFEADESDGSFLHLYPCIGIVSNIDADHLDYYKYFQGVKDAFLSYINRIPFYGYSVLCIDDRIVREILPLVERPYRTYGLSEDADYRADGIAAQGHETSFRCFRNGEPFGEFTIRQLGRHNVVNALAVIAVADELGLSASTIREGLAEFRGVGRRLELIGEAAGVMVYDDYGHHPTEIKATLEAIKVLGKRVVVVFQPHRYTRTQILYDEFGQCFAKADELFLTSIYPAGEIPIEGVSSDLIRESILRHDGRSVEIIDRLDEVPTRIASFVKKDDVVLTLGAGDIYRIAPRILEQLRMK